MESLINSIKSMRPLLVVAGAAATAVGVFYYYKRRGDEERRAETTDTSPTHDSSPLDRSFTSDEDSTDFEDSLDDGWRSYDMAMEIISQLERKISYLTHKQNLLLEDHSQNRILYKDLQRKHEKVVQAHRNLKAQYLRIKTEHMQFLRRREQEQIYVLRVMGLRAFREALTTGQLPQMEELQ